MSGASSTTTADQGELVEDDETTGTVSTGLTPLEHTSSDRMLLAGMLAGLTFLVLRDSPNRMTWIAVAAAIGAFLLPKFFKAFRLPEGGGDRWAMVNPFAADPSVSIVAFLT